MEDLEMNEIAVTKKGTHIGDSRCFVTTNMMGVGEEVRKEYPGAEGAEMARLMIEEQFKFAGIVVSSWHKKLTPPEQGAVVAIGGICSAAAVNGYDYTPGTPLRITLPPNSTTHSGGNTKDNLGIPLAKYGWKVVPDDPMLTAKAVNRYICEYVKNEEKYKRVLGFSGKQNADKWTTFCKAYTDSGLSNGLSFVYTMMKHGLLEPTDPMAGVISKFDGKHTFFGDFKKDMTPEAWKILMSEKMGLQDPDISNIPSSVDARAFGALKRLTLLGMYYDGTFRDVEFGCKNPDPDFARTRDQNTGAINRSSREGTTLYNDLNHQAISVSTLIQAIDSQNSKRIGFATSGVHRKKRIPLCLTPTCT